MNESESYKNWALEELMNYVKSVTEVQNDLSYEGSLNQNMPINRNEYYKNWALEELMNYVKSATEVQNNASCGGSLNQIIPVQNNLVEVEFTEISRETIDISSQFQIEANEEIALSPSNLTNLMALIQELQLSNGNLVKRVTYLSQAIAEFNQDLETYKVQFHAASSRLREQDRELEANYQTIQAQQSSIEKLTRELANYKEIVVQVQADYNEQSYQLSAEKDNCRDLRTRLNREQQHSLQLKVALEKCLEVPAASYQLADDGAVLRANNLEDSTNFTAKAPPIKPWTTQTRCSGNQIDLSWERQNSPSQTNADVEQTNDVQPVPNLEPLDSLMSEDELEEAIALTDIEEMPVASPIETNQIKTYTKSPSPLVYPSRPPKGRKSLASIELPSFIS